MLLNISERVKRLKRTYQVLDAIHKSRGVKVLDENKNFGLITIANASFVSVIVELYSLLEKRLLPARKEITIWKLLSSFKKDDTPELNQLESDLNALYDQLFDDIKILRNQFIGHKQLSSIMAQRDGVTSPPLRKEIWHLISKLEEIHETLFQRHHNNRGYSHTSSILRTSNPFDELIQDLKCIN